MKTNSDRLLEVESKVSSLLTESGRLKSEHFTIITDQKELTRNDADIATRLAVLESQIADARRSQDSWNGRFWLLFSILVAGLLTLVGNLIVLIAKIYSDA